MQHGELSLINFIKNGQKQKVSPSDIVMGIGDDCSVIEANENEYFITSTDMLIENTHFKKDKIPADHLGWKSAAVTYSDLAAMGGGEPLYIYLSLGLPDLKDISYIESFFQGFNKCIKLYGGHLAGGDTVQSEKITINVLIQGKIKKDRVKLRSKAKDGDIICVLNSLGMSELGLKEILEGDQQSSSSIFINSHHKPTPKLVEANWLSQFAAVTSMIDLSDGLLSEVGHLCDMSQTDAHIQHDKIPVDPRVLEIIKQSNSTLSFCEEYTLLFTISPDQFPLIQEHYTTKFEQPFFPIGKMMKRAGEKREISIQSTSPISFELVPGFEHR